MYNLASALKREGGDEQARDVLKDLRATIREYKENHNLPTFYPNTTKPSGKRKRSSADEGDRSGGGHGPAHSGGDAAHQLKACGYELVPDSFVDGSGGIWEQLLPVQLRNCFLGLDLAITYGLQLPPHVCTVYRVTDPSKTELIAKRVHKHSNELVILHYLRTIRPQSPHVISLIETIANGGVWLILPKLLPIIGLPMQARGVQLHDKLVQYSCDLIKGLAYLHSHGVAHLDIKPRNLVYANPGHLQIIDFDSAVQVESEEGVIQGLCGTYGWRAPEIGDDEEEAGPPPVFSPIRADRWSCGQVLIELLGWVDCVGTEVELLVEFAKQLRVSDPLCRPSLLNWDGLRDGRIARDPKIRPRADSDLMHLK